MFTGIIEAVAPIVAVKKDAARTVRFKMPRGWKLASGESINVDGICSTVVRRGSAWFDVEYMPTTLQKTTAARFARGGRVNLERSLAYGARMSGHFVLGHVDTRAKVRAVARGKGQPVVTFAMLPALSRFIVPRGSVAISGVSLTVAKKDKRSFSVALIPYTTAHTTLGKLRPGDFVNIEVDVIARYGRVRKHARG